MFLNLLLSISIWMATLLILHLILPCLNFLPWKILTIAFIVSLSLSVVLHMYQWKCWKFILSGRPKQQTVDFTQIVLFVGWLYVISGSALSVHCHCFPWALFTIIPMVIYTASVLLSSSDEPSNVNAPSLLESKITSSSGSPGSSSSESPVSSMSSPSSTIP